MILSANLESDSADEPCLACRATRRWQDHLAEHGTPPDGAEFINLWPHADAHTMRTILRVLAICEASEGSNPLTALCECTAAKREQPKAREAYGPERFEPERVLPVGHEPGKGGALQDAAQDAPLGSVPHLSRPWRRLAAACIGLVVVVGGAIGWHAHFNDLISRTLELARLGQYAETLDEWEASSLDWIERSTILQNEQEVVDFELLDENTDGYFTLSGAEVTEPVEAELARRLVRQYYNTARKLIGESEAEVHVGVDALLLELEIEPAWAWLRYLVQPIRQFLLEAAQYPEGRDTESHD